MIAADAHGGSMVNPIAGNMTHEEWITYGLGVKLTVSGGTFTNNSAFAGGAFYISSNDTEINAATIKNNTATRFGGGIYLSAVPYVLQMRNVLIEENNAENIDKDISSTYNGVTIDMPQGSGGGVWYCPTGDSEVYISNGVAFLGNGATHDGDDFTSVTKDSGNNYSVTIYERMLGGGLVHWYRDGDSQDTSVPRFNSSQPPLSTITGTSDALSLKAVEQAKEGASYDAARQLATVIMSGNKAGRGGAIGSNGTVIFGDRTKSSLFMLRKSGRQNLQMRTEKRFKSVYLPSLVTRIFN